jgi:hypothetical protein
MGTWGVVDSSLSPLIRDFSSFILVFPLPRKFQYFASLLIHDSFIKITINYLGSKGMIEEMLKCNQSLLLLFELLKLFPFL